MTCNHYRLSGVLETRPYLQIVLLMELSQNIHDGHGPGVLGSEDLQQREEFMPRSAVVSQLMK